MTSEDFIHELYSLIGKYSDQTPDADDTSDQLQYIRQRLPQLLPQQRHAIRQVTPEQLLLWKAKKSTLEQMYQEIAKPKPEELKAFSKERDRLVQIQMIQRLADEHPRLFRNSIDKRLFATQVTVRRFTGANVPSMIEMRRTLSNHLGRDPFSKEMPDRVQMSRWDVLSANELSDGDYAITLIKGTKPKQYISSEFTVVETDTFQIVHLMFYPGTGQLEIRGTNDIFDQVRTHMIMMINAYQPDQARRLNMQATSFAGLEERLAQALGARLLSTMFKDNDEGDGRHGETAEFKVGDPSGNGDLTQGRLLRAIQEAMASGDLQTSDISQPNSSYAFMEGTRLIIYEVWPDRGQLRFSRAGTTESDITKVMRLLNHVESGRLPVQLGNGGRPSEVRGRRSRAERSANRRKKKGRGGK